MQQRLAITSEAASAIRHDAAALSLADLTTKVCLAGLAEFAFFALRGVEGDDVISWLHGGDARSNRLDNTSSLVTEYDREGALGVLAGEGVGI